MASNNFRVIHVNPSSDMDDTSDTATAMSSMSEGQKRDDMGLFVNSVRLACVLAGGRACAIASARLSAGARARAWAVLLIHSAIDLKPSIRSNVTCLMGHRFPVAPKGCVTVQPNKTNL